MGRGFFSPPTPAMNSVFVGAEHFFFRHRFFNGPGRPFHPPSSAYEDSSSFFYVIGSSCRFIGAPFLTGVHSCVPRASGSFFCSWMVKTPCPRPVSLVFFPLLSFRGIRLRVGGFRPFC